MNDPNKDNKQNQNNQHNQPPRGPNLFNVVMIILFITLVLNMFTSSWNRKDKIQTSYSDFISLVESDNVSTVDLDDGEIRFLIKEEYNKEDVEDILLPKDQTNQDKELEKIFGEKEVKYNENIYITGKTLDAELMPLLKEHNVKINVEPKESASTWTMILSWILPFLLLYLIYYFFMRNMMKKMGQGGMGSSGNMFSVGKSKAKEYNIEEKTGVTFKDVAGQDEAKESLEEIIDFLHNPGKYKDIGAQQPKGALLVGPPGTGKTLIAKAVAGEAGVPFYHLSGSEFVEMFVGVGASRVRDLFQTANKNAPAIIFIDEIDAIGKKRDNQMSSNDEREQTLNQLLAEMDGFDSSIGIVVLAATNRPEVLDKALLRPGRFDRQIPVELPDLSGREAILKVHATDVKMDENVNLRDIALATNGASGADLANMINEAALRAVKFNRDKVIQEDLMESVEVVIAGQEKKDRVMNEKERRMVAYHEVGHALVTALQKNAQPVHKITIVPRTKGSLGYTMSLPEEERYLLTKDEVMAEINTLMGGRAAELVEFGIETTGASNDIERATKLARSMVTQYGMSDRFGPMGMESVESRYLDGRAVSTVSEKTNALVDEEVQKILADSQNHAIQLLKDNLEALEKISEFLLEKENITGEEFMELLNKVRDDEDKETIETPDTNGKEISERMKLSEEYKEEDEEE